MPHADDIAALRRLLEGVEGFAGKMGWERRRLAGVGREGWSTHVGHWLDLSCVQANQHDIDQAVGVAMEMLRERHGVRHLGRLIAEAVPDDAEFGSKGSPRLLPLLADVLCEPGGREGA